MANERLYESKMLLGALYRSELARGLDRLGYGIEKTHADGRFEIAGVPRTVIEAFSTRRAEIEAAVAERGGGATADDQRLAQRAALMTRAAKRDVDRDALRESWLEQAEGLGFDARGLAAQAKEAGREAAGESGRGTAAEREAGPASGPAETGAAAREDARGPAVQAVDWAVAHLSEREAVFARTDLLAAALAFDPGGADIAAVEPSSPRARPPARSTPRACQAPRACSPPTARSPTRRRPSPSWPPAWAAARRPCAPAPSTRRCATVP